MSPVTVPVIVVSRKDSGILRRTIENYRFGGKGDGVGVKLGTVSDYTKDQNIKTVKYL